jgi:serine/threonine protein kinase
VARTYKGKAKAKDTIAMGSAGYAPPEQYGKGQTDARSDLYALGATLLHLLTNLPPVPLQAPAPGSISRINQSVGQNTEQVIIKSMALNRDERYNSSAEMEQALAACLDGAYVDPTLRAAPPPPVAPMTNVSGSRPPQAVPPTAIPPMKPAVAATVTAAPSASQAPTQLPATQPGPGPAAPVGVPCPKCGRLNKAGARFCATCGTPLTGPPVARLFITSPRGSWEMKLDRMPCRIGRRDPRQNHYPELDLAEYDRGIASRHHATIGRDGDFYTLTDVGSTNGTMLNGAMVPPRQAQRLRQGDRIKIGEVEMEFRWS